ncbi:hypothetical protein C8T65DRAFT_65205 [Cerioporus squamosus]|nr:hypothetical protein C8T65DRAFT_65205 [Cerioporus squamosus]
MVLIGSIADSYWMTGYLQLHRRNEHPHDYRGRPHDDIREGVSRDSANPQSKNQTDAIIGAAAAGSVVLLMGAIFLGYWLTKRRKSRRCAPSQVWITESRPVLEAPRKARKYSLALFTPSTITRPPPLWIEKPLPSPPLTTSLMSSDPFSAALTITPFSSEKSTWPDSQKSAGLLDGTPLLSSPPPTHLKLGPARSPSVSKAKSSGKEGSRTVLVAQEMDSGMRLVDPVVVPPPYTFR